MDESAVANGLLAMLHEAFEGSPPGQGSGFLDSTKADGSRNSGLFATLDALTPEQASQPTVLGLSVAAHAAHAAFHLEVSVRWLRGERGPFDWANSFDRRALDAAAWAAARARVRAAFGALMAAATSLPEWNEDAGVTYAASLAHVAYHLGAIRQVAKLARG